MSTESWSAVEVPLTIEYSQTALDEIRDAVWVGFQRLARGGLEVGGILYGHRRDRTLEIVGAQPMVCQHAFGPGFVLSAADRAALQKLLEAPPEAARLGDAIALGWFVSHTRSGILLTASDTEIFEAYFPEPWQITLVVHPERDGSMRGGFFVREADGSIRTSGSYREFDFPERLAARPGIPLDPREGRREGSKRGRSASAMLTNGIQPISDPAVTVPEPPEAPLEPAAPEPPPPAAGLPAFAFSSDPPSFAAASPPAGRLKWLWLTVLGLAAIGLALLGVLWGVQRMGIPRVAEPVSLTLIERDGQLRIEWSRAAPAVTAAVNGALDIVDGGETQTIALAPQDLARGELPYMRKSGDVEVRMSLRGPAGQKVEEASRFLGSEPAKKTDSTELNSLQQQRQNLEAEVNRLRGENAAQAGRIKELETALRVLQDRLALTGR
jgi:hypothetical protein